MVQPKREGWPEARVLAEIGPEPKIALLRAGGLGDFISTTAALKALREALPHASMTLVTSPTLAAFARRYDAFDRIVVAPPYPGVVEGLPDEAALAAFLAAMRAERFGLALQWHGGGTHSNQLVRQLGARLTAGFRGDDAEPLDYWLPYDIRQHEVLRYLDLLRLLGIPSADVRTYLPVLASDYQELSALSGLIDLEALDAGRYLGLHASAGGRSRRWAGERFARVADHLLEEFDFQGVLVTAGPGQEADSATVVKSMVHRRRAVDLGGKLTLGALVALISRLRLFMTNDSGPAHMAIALDIPSLVVFGAAHPANWAPLERTWHRLVANWESPCRWLLRDGCADTSEVECLLEVQPEAVLAEARRLIRLLDRMRPINRSNGVPLPRRVGVRASR